MRHRRLTLGFAWASVLLVVCMLVEVYSVRELTRVLERADRARKLLDARDELAVLELGSVEPAVASREFELLRDLAANDDQLLRELDVLERANDAPSLGGDTQLGSARAAALRRIAQREHEVMSLQLGKVQRRLSIARVFVVFGSLVGLATAAWFFLRLLKTSRAHQAAEQRARRQEAQLLTTLDSIGDGVVSTDLEGRLLHANPIAIRWSGRAALGEVVGIPFNTLYGLELVEGVVAPVDCLAKALSGAGPCSSRTVRLRGHAEAGEMLLSVNAAPLREDDRKVHGAVIVMRDVTLERRAAADMQQANELLEARVRERTRDLEAAHAQLQAESRERERAAAQLHEANLELRRAQKVEALGKLAAGIAHDFNNALSIILSTSEVILEDAAGESALRSDLDIVRKAGLHAAELTRKLLAFSRKQLLRPRVVLAEEIIRDTLVLLRSVLGAGVRVETRLARATCPVLVDPGQFEQVLVNLAINARDAMPRGGVLTIATEQVHSPRVNGREFTGAFLLLSVTDTGSGIPPELRECIFEPFFTTKEEGKGTGLGLATVCGIVEQSGGTVAVDSEVGAGTTFRLYLPAAAAPELTPPTPVPAPVTSEGPASGTILVVLPEPTLRGVVTAILSRAGYQTVVAANAVEARSLAAQFSGRIDLLVTELSTMGGTGPELRSSLRRQHPELHALYLSSGHVADEAVHREVSEGLAELLEKPIQVAPLRAKVRESLVRVSAQMRTPGIESTPRC